MHARFCPIVMSVHIFFYEQAPGLVIKKSGISSTDDDINDVAAMGGVNIADENKVIED